MIINPNISMGASTLRDLPSQLAAPDNVESFGSLVKGAVNEVKSTQIQADNAVQQFALGNSTDVHQVMLAMEQARMTLTLAVETRNKVVEAYQEISRMQV